MWGIVSVWIKVTREWEGERRTLSDLVWEECVCEGKSECV